MGGKSEKKRNRHARWEDRQERSKATREELTTLQEKVDELKKNIPEESPVRFDDLPISGRTQLGLERGNFKKLTTIQSEALPYTLTGRDVLGAAKTGSGKTLCFVLPALERLFLQRWTNDDGVGVIILSPTRELSLQIFKVVQVIGYKHTFSVALLTGGRDVNEERKRLHAINIIVGTPGRVLHHLSEDSNMTVDNLQMLVMDEADRLLDMGFRETMVAILDSLPRSRQTLLFSATQTRDVQMLATMSLKDPKYVAAHADSIAPTPSQLSQNFVVVELHRKLDALLMFIKRHPNDKTVVFLSTCNQVKFMYLAFSKILKKMRVPSMCLTGKMKQFRREEVFLTFCRCKSAVLFCTDIASRGLDFPMVHWVIQHDCPESPQTYIHRVGRTARAGARGAAVMFLTPRELPMLNYLHQRKVPLREIAIRPGLLQESKQIFVALVVQGLKYDAQKAFIGYLRSLHFAANKAVFDLSSVDLEKFAHSLGLMVVPNTSELKITHRSAKNVPYDVMNFMDEAGRERVKANLRGEKDLDSDDDEEGSGEDDDLEQDLEDVEEGSEEEDDEGQAKKAAPLTRKERHLKASDMFRQMDLKHKRYNPNAADAADSGEDDDGLFSVRRTTIQDIEGSKDKGAKELTFDERMAGLSKNKKKKLVQEADLRVKDLGLSKHTKFGGGEDDEDVDGSEEEDPATIRRLGRDVIGRTGDDSESSDDDEAADDFEYGTKLADRLRVSKQEDAERAKGIRRKRLLKKAGRLDKDEDGGASDASSSVSYDDETMQLFKAARGEMTSSEDDDDEDDEGAEVYESSGEEAEAPPKAKARK